MAFQKGVLDGFAMGRQQMAALSRMIVHANKLLQMVSTPPHGSIITPPFQSCSLCLTISLSYHWSKKGQFFCRLTINKQNGIDY
jgi:hypothetical protein